MDQTLKELYKVWISQYKRIIAPYESFCNLISVARALKRALDDITNSSYHDNITAEELLQKTQFVI
jgi:hypothetical protein